MDIPIYPFDLFYSTLGLGTVTGLTAAYCCVYDREFRRNVESHDDPSFVGNLLGCAAFIEGRLDDSVRHFEAGTASGMFRHQAHYNYVVALLASGRVARAADFLHNWDARLANRARIGGDVSWETLKGSAAFDVLDDLAMWPVSWIAYALSTNNTSLGVAKVLVGATQDSDSPWEKTIDRIDGIDELRLARVLAERAGLDDLAHAMAKRAEWLSVLT